MSLHLTLLLLAAVGVLANTQSGNSQAAIDHGSNGPSSSPGLTAPAELVPVSAENLRFSRLLKDSANVLQFSSISNDAPPIWGIARDGKKDAKDVKFAKKNAAGGGAGANFGRRALDYDEQLQAFEETTSESKIVANPYPGNEYVFVRPGKLIEIPADSDSAASVTSINNKPPRVPLALLRQKKGKRVNISPLFTEVPEVHRDEAKEFVWVDQPAERQRFVAVNRQGRKHEDEDEATTNPVFQEEDLVEATTIAEEIPVETTTARQSHKSKLIVNVVTSAPRYSVESTVNEKKVKQGSRPRKTSSTTTTATTTTGASTTSEATTTTTTEAASTTTLASSTTSQLPTTVQPPVLSSSSPKAISADDKENLVADAFHRSGSSFHGFEDSQTRLLTAESNQPQPARVNVRPSQNGKEYEYEYIYYYYDDDENENGEKNGEHGVKSAGHTKESKSAASSTSASSSATLTPASASDAASSTTVTISSSSTTSTTTLAPDLTSDTDFEYEDDAALEEEIKAHSKAPELQKSTPALIRTTDEPIHKGVSSAEKLSNSNPINQLDRSRGPKILPGKFDESVADYKLETEASQEDEVIQTQSFSKGQPQIQQATSSEEDEQTADSPAPSIHVTSRQPSTSAPGSTSGFDIEHMSTLAKNHKDSVNVPIVLKQSTLLKAVPVSQLQSHLPEEQPSTAPFTTPTTTTTTVEAASEAVPSVRPSPPRLRGHRLRGSVTPRPSTSTTTGVASEQPSEEKPQTSVRRPHLRESSRRIPSRRPAQESADNTPEQQPAASPIIENHARPVPVRPRFPPRTGGHTTTTAASPIEVTVSDAAPVTVSAAELNSLDDKRTKDAHVRAKSANDLFAFARLQQAISSRAPSRVQPKLVAGFVNSVEVTTDAITSSEVTTVSSFGGQSGETLGAVSAEPTTTTTTTTTTTEAVQLDKFGRQRGGPRFGGRTRKPIGGGTGGAGSTTTTETPATTRGRFTGRRRASTTETPEGTAPQTSDSATTNDAPKPRLPTRNRFASRNRGSTTEVSATADQQKTGEADKPAVTQPRRRPGTFQGRRRPNQIQGQTDAPAVQEETASTSADSSSTATVTSTAAPASVAPGRNRFNFAAAGGRARPAQAAGNNPVRIRGGGRLRGPTTTTTTEAAPVEADAEEAQEQPADAEQSQSIQTENLEQPIHSSPAPESVAPPRGSGGVLGRLKNRPKLVVTTTTIAPDASGDRKPSRLNGILNRRKNIGQLNGAVHVKEEVRESTSEVAEEANNHAQEQDDDHKGVVVQISSSVTESEEVNEAHAGEVVEPPSTTPGSILNRLKSQRKPGSLFRKKPDPHGE